MQLAMMFQKRGFGIISGMIVVISLDAIANIISGPAIHDIYLQPVLCISHHGTEKLLSALIAPSIS